MADNKQPYGNVSYADPGYQKDGVRRYPLDSEGHVRSAWSYINMPKNAQQYSGSQLAAIKGRIRAAAKRYGIQINEQNTQEAYMAEIERRFTLVPVEVRVSAGGEQRRTIGGYAAQFNRLSNNIGGFVERIDPAFFNKSRGDGWPDVIARYNHDNAFVLGTTASGTLRCATDGAGLGYEVDMPQTRQDVFELVERRDVSKSSFAFKCEADEWTLSDQNYPMRTLLTGRLIDVAPCHAGIAAYSDTTVGLRSLAAKFEADVEEIRTLAETNELRKLFLRTDGTGPAKKPLLGAMALVELEAKRDPWEDTE